MSTNFNPTPFTAKDGSQYVAVVAGVDSMGNPDPLQTDGSGALNISATISGADGAITDGSSSSIKATVLDYTNSNPLAVRLTDTNGDYIAAGAGTQYTEDAAAAANPIGNATILVRADTLAGVTTTDGDNVAARGTDKGELYVKHVDAIPVTDNGSSLTVDGTVSVTGVSTAAKQDTGNTSLASIDGKVPALGQALAAASVPVVLTAAQLTTLTPPAAITGFATSAKQDTGNTSLGTIDTSTAAINTVLGAKTDAKSTATDGTSVSAMQVLKQISASVQAPPSQAVTNAGTFAVQATVAAGATNIAKAEDVASADADVGVPAMAIRKATPANTSGTDGDYEMLQMSAGRLWTSSTIDTALPAGTNAIGKLAANDGVDIGDVTINNSTGASAVNIQDGGNSITVDGTVSITANSSVNVAQIAGTTTDTNSGNKSAGTLRVVLATDQPQLTNKLLVTPDANSAVNVAQVGGSNVVTATTGVQKVGIVGNAAATVDSTVAAGSAPTNQIVTGQVYNTTAPAPTNGQAMAMQSDQAGNHLVAPGIATASLSVWNSGTSINTTQNIFTKSGVPAALVHIVQSGGTFSAGAITFEVTYDNSNWITISADCVLDPTSTSLAQISLPYTLVTSTNKGFLLLTKGAQGLRIKLSTAITGTGTVTPNYALLPSNPVQQVLAYNPTATNLKAQAEVYQGGSAVASGNPLQVTLANTGANTNKILVTPDANSAVNVAQMNGVTVTMNNGAAGTGVQRVTIANDSTGNIATIGTSVTPGTAAANLGKAEDAAHTTGDTGVMMLGVRETTLTDLSAGNTDGDYEPFQVNKSGAVWVTGAPSGTSGWSVATGSIGATKTDIGTANTAGNVGGWYIYNPNSSVAYVQFFNAQASAVTLGTTAPVYSLGIPATSAANIAPGMVGISHSTAISIAVTTTRAGSTGPGSTVDYNIWFKQ